MRNDNVLALAVYLAQAFRRQPFDVVTCDARHVRIFEFVFNVLKTIHHDVDVIRLEFAD